MSDERLATNERPDERHNRLIAAAIEHGAEQRRGRCAVSDVTERAKAALEGVTPGPWICSPGDDEEASVVSEGERSPDPITIGGVTYRPGFSVAVDLRNGDAAFIAADRSLLPELLTYAEALEARVSELETRR